MSQNAYYGHLTSSGRSETRGEKKTQYFSILLLQPKMRIAIRDTYKALQPLKFCMQVRWGCAALSQERAAFSQASKAMLVFREISLMLCNRAVLSRQGVNGKRFIQVSLPDFLFHIVFSLCFVQTVPFTKVIENKNILDSSKLFSAIICLINCDHPGLKHLQSKRV